MAKVTGPLYSMTASGKIADAMVFFSWKGISVVRQWLIPKNKKSGEQGDYRLILGATGRVMGAVKPTSAFETKLNAAVTIPNDQTRQSYLVQKAITTFLPNPVALGTLYDEFALLTGLADFQAAGAIWGLTDFDILYKDYIHSFSGGEMIYLLAKIACFLGLAGAPYTTPAEDWTSTEIALMKVDCAAA
jgi:hypothetical protein